jgi:dihydrodipicolinate reductase
MQILLVGHGKMGRMVESLAGEYGCVVAGVIDPQSPGSHDGPDADRWHGVDVAIDFSSPEAVIGNVPVLKNAASAS